MEIIHEKVKKVQRIDDTSPISPSSLFVETTTKIFLIKLENEDTFTPRLNFCYEFHLEAARNGVFYCTKMLTNTVDFILLHNDSIVLIKRKHEPFKGCLALPGGFVDEGETPIEAAVRELNEEVNIKVKKEFLTPVVVQSKPFRDPRNKWTTAHVFTARVNDLSSIKAGDDADSYIILPLNELSNQNLAFDHLESIKLCLDKSCLDNDADLRAINVYLKMGYSKNDAEKAFIKIFSSTVGKSITELKCNKCNTIEVEWYNTQPNDRCYKDGCEGILKRKMEEFRMGIDPRPDWFQDKVTTNEITTHVVDEDEGEGGPFSNKKTWAMVYGLKANYGDVIVKDDKGYIYIKNYNPKP